MKGSNPVVAIGVGRGARCPYAKVLPNRSNAPRWKRTSALLPIRKARNLNAARFVVSNFNDDEGLGVGPVRHGGVVATMRAETHADYDNGMAVPH